MASSAFKSFLVCCVLLAVASSCFASLPARPAPVSAAVPIAVRQTSPTPSPSASDDAETSPEPEDVCVDAAYLSKYSAEHLVHPEHLLKDVLCPVDSSLPCATANHMLRVDGKKVSYALYCETKECTTGSVEVNSVMSHMWKEEEHDGAVLTMFDHRHPEIVQKVLHRLISFRRAAAKKFMK